MFKPEKFFDLSNFEYKDIFNNIEKVWEIIPYLPDFALKILKTIPKEKRIQGEVKNGAILIGDEIFIARGAKIEPTAYIEGPAIIGPNSIVGTAAYVRGGTILGKNCILGHCTESRNTLMLDGSKAPHFNFIGDSILGNNVNIGAGVILANLRLDSKNVPVGKENSGLQKFGAILGDRVKIGCNTVTEPGTLLAKDCWVFPCIYLRRGLYKKGRRKIDLIKKL